MKHETKLRTQGRPTRSLVLIRFRIKFNIINPILFRTVHHFQKIALSDQKQRVQASLNQAWWYWLTAHRSAASAAVATGNDRALRRRHGQREAPRRWQRVGRRLPRDPQRHPQPRRGANRPRLRLAQSSTRPSAGIPGLDWDVSLEWRSRGFKIGDPLVYQVKIDIVCAAQNERANEHTNK